MCLWHISLLRTLPGWPDSILGSFSDVVCTGESSEVDCLQSLQIGHHMLFVLMTRQLGKYLNLSSNMVCIGFQFFISWKMLLHIQGLETLNRRNGMQAYWFLNWCFHCGSCHPKDRDNYSKFCWVRNVNHDFHILLNLCFALWRMQFYVNIFSNFSSKFSLPWL